MASRTTTVMTFVTGLVVGYGVLYLLPGDDGHKAGMKPPGEEPIGETTGPVGPPDGELQEPEIPVGDLPPPGPDALPPLGDGVEEIPVDVPHFEPPEQDLDDGSAALRAHLVGAPDAWTAMADVAGDEHAGRCLDLARMARRMDAQAPPVIGVAALLLEERALLAELDAAGVDTSELSAQVEALRLL
ncbi:MAG: hypothetical protein GY913_20670 [Proteobacteria bacterium]|nr:hypothetical protein [Pseudomonadota bacterium]MCP4919322.1 hypothetical protein [Pseudomonadota bacterium]